MSLLLLIASICAILTPVIMVIGLVVLVRRIDRNRADQEKIDALSSSLKANSAAMDEIK